MIRQVLGSCLLLNGFAFGGLVNTQQAAVETVGITIKRNLDVKASLDEAPIEILFRPEKITSEFSIVVRSEESENVGEFYFISKAAGKVSEYPNVAKFKLKNGHLYRSYIRIDDFIIPLRLFFDQAGQERQESDEGLEPISSFETRTWVVPPTFLSPPAIRQPVDPFSANWNQEKTIRSWGLNPPEGTVFYYGMPTAQVMIRSTREFLNEVDAEMKKRYGTDGG